MELEIITLSEISQTHKDKDSVFPLMWNLCMGEGKNIKVKENTVEEERGKGRQDGSEEKIRQSNRGWRYGLTVKRTCC